MECTENRKFDLNGVPDKLPEEAWTALQKASDERDLEEFREVSISFLASLLQSLTVSRTSKFTPRRFPRPRLWISRRRCVRKTLKFTSLRWCVTHHSMEYIRILILGVIGEADWRLHVPDQPSGQAQLQVRGRLLFQPQAAAGDSARALAPVGRGEPGSS